MGLVDYGSDSDSDSPSTTTPSIPSTSSSSLKLPPPSTSSSTSKLALPAPTNSKKRPSKGPVRIRLDDLSQAAQAEQDSTNPSSSSSSSSKKPKLTLGGGKSNGLSGLAAMLPKPKNEVKLPPPSTSASSSKSTTATNGTVQGEAGLGDMFGSNSTTRPSTDTTGGMFVPHTVSKGKGKVKSTLPPPPPVEPQVDFFGIGSVTTSIPSTSTSSSSTSKPTLSSAPTISSAPSISSSSSSSSKPRKEPTLEDPYPGFTQLPSGEWVAKDQETYELALKWQQQASQRNGEGEGEEGIPKGFDEREIVSNGGYRDVDEAKRAKDAWATRPGQVGTKEEEYKKSTAIKGIPKQASQQARRKGQLSSLIAEAHDNRAELEERIAQARANRKSAGNKYGF